MLNDANRFLVLLSDATKYDPHGTTTLADLVREKLKAELTAALVANHDEANWGYVPPPAGVMVWFIIKRVISPEQRELLDRAEVLLSDLFKVVQSTVVRQVLLTCLLLGNPGAMAEISDYLSSIPTQDAADFIAARGSFDAMYAYIESFSDVPFRWWLNLNPLAE